MVSPSNNCLRIKNQVKLINSRQKFQNLGEYFLLLGGETFSGKMILVCICTIETTQK